MIGWEKEVMKVQNKQKWGNKKKRKKGRGWGRGRNDLRFGTKIIPRAQNV